MCVVSILPQVHCCDKSDYEVIQNLLTLDVKFCFAKEPITLRLFGYTLDERYEWNSYVMIFELQVATAVCMW